MNPLERLLLEEIPTGTFGGPRPDDLPQTVTSDAVAAAHCAELEAELDEHDRQRHLRAVPTPSEGAA